MVELAKNGYKKTFWSVYSEFSGKSVGGNQKMIEIKKKLKEQMILVRFKGYSPLVKFIVRDIAQVLNKFQSVQKPQVWQSDLVAELEERKKLYQKLANKKVQVKRQYFQGKADAFAEALDLLKKESTKK